MDVKGAQKSIRTAAEDVGFSVFILDGEFGRGTELQFFWECRGEDRARGLGTRVNIGALEQGLGGLL